MKKKISQKAEVEYQQHQFNRRPTQKGLIHSKSFVLAYIVLYGICTSEAALGKPSCEKSAVFLNTRSYAALRAADLDWIVGPGYSSGRVHS